MRERAFGATGERVPVVGQGTWQLRDAERAAEALRAGTDLGMRHVDTAELYRGSERVIRDALGERRDALFLVSKVLPRHATETGTRAACEKSLERLGTDRLDAYLIHWWDDGLDLDGCMRAMDALVDEGKVRHVGVSNFDVDELEAAKEALAPRRLACNQVLYHLQDRGMESDVLPWCKENGVAVVGYSPFGSIDGFPSPRSRGGRVLHEVAADVGKTPRQVALAFLARDEHVFLIPKAERVEHVRENAGGDFVLPKDAVARLDEAFPVTPGLRLL